MSKYSPLVNFETEFEGDTVKMQLKHLSRKTFLGWMPYFSKVEKIDDGEGNTVVKLDEETTLNLVNDAADILPQHVKDFKGLKDTNGDPVSIDVVIEDVYFMELVSEIVVKLIEMARVGKETTEGKSEGPRAASSKV
jgi:hypothetical protein